MYTIAPFFHSSYFIFTSHHSSNDTLSLNQCMLKKKPAPDLNSAVVRRIMPTSCTVETRVHISLVQCQFRGAKPPRSNIPGDLVARLPSQIIFLRCEIFVGTKAGPQPRPGIQQSLLSLTVSLRFLTSLALYCFQPIKCIVLNLHHVTVHYPPTKTVQ